MMISSPHMQRPPSGGPMNSPQQQPQVQQQQQPPPGYIYQKPGLRGGAPIHGFSRGAKRLPTASTSTAGQSQAPQTSNPVVIVTRSEGIIKEINNVTILKKKGGATMKAGTLKAATGSRIIHRGKVANIMQAQEDYDDTSNASTMSTPTTFTVQPHTINRNLKRTASDSCYTTTKSPLTQQAMLMDDIVVIDSSPDEKQRIMDYDDDNDKSVIGPEVSLSSVAQNAIDGDEVSVIYDTSAGNDFNIVSSPLESEEISEEYPLFPCVADYVDDGERHTIESPNEDDSKSMVDDSDDEGKHVHSESPVYLDDLVNLDTNSEEHFATTEEEIMSMNSEIIIMDSSMKTPEDRLHNTAEDFEAMIDSGNSKDGKESNSSIELMEIEPEQDLPLMKPTKPATMSKESTSLNKGRVITVVVPQSSASSTKPQIVSYGRKTITATAIVTPKSAVYSTVPSSASTHNLVKDATQAKYLLGDQTISVPILKNAIPLARVSGAKGNAETTNKKIIGQSAIISTSLSNISLKKINTSNFVTLSPLNIQHSSGGRIVQAQILRAQPTQQTVTAANQRKITSIGGPQIAKSLPPTLTYSKIGTSLASLKVSQDVSLPTKLFEDESISPDSSIEQDESDLMLTEETIYTTEDSNQNHRDSNEIGVSFIFAFFSCVLRQPHFKQKKIIQFVYLSGKNKKLQENSSPMSTQDRMIEVDEMLNDDWKRSKSSSSSPIIKTDSHSNASHSEKSQDAPEKQKPTVQIPVHVIIKSCESPNTNLQPATRLTSNLPQLSPLSQPNEITSNMANASQQLRSIMSSINQTTNTTTGLTTSNQNKSVTTTVEIKAMEAQVSAANTQLTSSASVTGKTENTVANVVPTSFENVLAVNRNNELNAKAEALPKIVTETVPTTITAGKILTSTQAFNQNNIGSITTTSAGSILVVKQLRTVSPMTSRSRSPVTVNSSGAKTFSVVKSSMGGTPIIISGQAAQPGSSVIITQNKVPILTKVATSSSIVSVANTISGSATNPITVSTSVSKNTTQTMSILSNTLSQPQQSRIVPYAEGQHITISKKPIKLPILTKIENATVVSNASVTSASSTAAIQNILQSGLYSHPTSGSILSATLSQPSQKPNAKLLQTQLTNNPFRRSKSTDEVPGFLKETPAQIISKRHSSMEASNTIKDEKDDATTSTVVTPKTTENATENCKFTTVTMVHKSDESQNVLLKQLLQQVSNTAPTPSSMPTIVSRSVTSLRAPSLGVVSSLEAQLARPVILPVPATPNAIQSKPNTLSTGKTGKNVCCNLIQIIFYLTFVCSLLSNTLGTATTTTSQSFSAQINSTSKTNAAVVAPSVTPVEAPKNSVRPHQILSRETSFISKPITEAEKDDASTIPQPVVATVQVTTPPQITVPTIITTNATNASAPVTTVTCK